MSRLRPDRTRTFPYFKGVSEGVGISRVSVDLHFSLRISAYLLHFLYCYVTIFYGRIYLRGSDAFPTGNCRGRGHHTVRITGNKSWLAVPHIKDRVSAVFFFCLKIRNKKHRGKD